MKREAIMGTCAAALFLLGCSPGPGRPRRVQTVKVDTVIVHGESETIAFPGRVQASTEANLAFRVSGKIRDILAREGERVRCGQLLARLDDRDYALQLAATTAESEQVRGDATRVIELYRRGGATTSDYDKARHGLTQVEAKLASHANALADTRLEAPFDAHVQKVYFSAGEMIVAGVPVVSLVGEGTPEVVINIPAAEYLRRGRFARFTCRVEALGEGLYPLALLGIARKANLNHLYATRFRLLAPPGARLPAPGMSATVRIEFAPEAVSRVSVPASALFVAAGERRAWVYDPASGSVRARRVEVSGMLTGGRVLLDGGLAAGELVVSAGVHSLREGEAVKVLQSPSETNVGGML
ncbi:MAG: efflux RND transporter periplasmic adaptor subunit [Odoribacteraceae bacterium]|jgi:RND family efflux transporter MFP subunit|nr:efflux RND transporter periplasmic adaptor subunit [Odoribacteraceae bacterium]